MGRASSTTWSPTVGKLIAFGHLRTEHSEPGSQVTVPWEIPGTDVRIDVEARVATLPFLELRRS